MLNTGVPFQMSDEDDFDFDLVLPLQKATRAKRLPDNPADDTKHKACWPVQEDTRTREQGKEHGFLNNTKETPFLECTLCRNIELDAVRKLILKTMYDKTSPYEAMTFAKVLVELLNSLEHRKK